MEADRPGKGRRQKALRAEYRATTAGARDLCWVENRDFLLHKGLDQAEFSMTGHEVETEVVQMPIRWLSKLLEGVAIKH